MAPLLPLSDAAKVTEDDSFSTLETGVVTTVEPVSFDGEIDFTGDTWAADPSAPFVSSATTSVRPFFGGEPMTPFVLGLIGERDNPDVGEGLGGRGDVVLAGEVVSVE